MGLNQWHRRNYHSFHLLLNIDIWFFFNWQLTAGTVDVALYNITTDPEERNDLSQVLPDVVKKMKERMDYYINSRVPPLFKGTDPNALKVARKNGIWGPWMWANVATFKNCLSLIDCFNRRCEISLPPVEMNIVWGLRIKMTSEKNSDVCGSWF